MNHKPTNKYREVNQTEAVLGLGAVASGAFLGEGKLREEPFKSPKWKRVRQNEGVAGRKSSRR